MTAKYISVSIPVGLAEVIDEHIKTHNNFRSRADLVIHATRRLIEMNGGAKRG